MNKIMHGDAFEDKEYLDSVSAINYTDKIKNLFCLFMELTIHKFLIINPQYFITK